MWISFQTIDSVCRTIQSPSIHLFSSEALILTSLAYLSAPDNSLKLLEKYSSSIVDPKLNVTMFLSLAKAD